MEGLVRAGFDPPGEAEPDTTPQYTSTIDGYMDNESLVGSGRRGSSSAVVFDSDGRVVVTDQTPTVLTKLQKWADYESIGEPLYPTMFLPMKTPMSQEIIDNWSLEDPPKHVLTVQELVESQLKVDRCVGMIIDLANHECLYQDDLPEGGLEYAHVQLVAKVLPSKDAVDEVERVAKEFWSRHPDQHIAIHCAYGFNRTGFIVCSYLCQAHGMTVDEALASFAKARPPGVKHGKFIDELYARYGGSPRVVRNSETGLLKAELAFCQGIPGSDGESPVIHREDVNMDSLNEATSSSRTKGILMRSAPSSIRRSNSASRMPHPDESEYSRSYHSAGALENEELAYMAKTLNFSTMMRRETSLGLAKALHDDFGQHDFHADEIEEIANRAKRDMQHNDDTLTEQDCDNNRTCTIL